ncbi:MAG TPA: Asp-tRNA(Asn)/Glu-tRNA(Gln) amidotransferase subunit GatB [Candidatus Polarisedimenticolia bacterium]|nr:Asp-tRNA(Asn)/Glu-tRNA(Gln) amidotransferase subunit GatB [Candidatus Polarisedimenticolia bacterium]
MIATDPPARGAGAPSAFEPVIGLEVHAQLKTASKIFCGCPTRFGAPPNANVCPVCLGMPGVLPVLNRRAVEFALKAALATGCRVNARSIFARKNYFYPDLPKGYQISMYETPLAEHGSVPIEVDGATRTIGLTRIHMEEDAGKLVHEGMPDSASRSYVDFNRSGVPLIEIVSEPDITSPEEAHAYLTRLRSILVYLDVCDGNMEEGSLRCDANVSIRPKGSKKFGVKVEIKNLNSFRNVVRALEHEIERQAAALAAGEPIVQQTRLFDADRGVTEPMRSKEEAMDYRYFPEPDLPPLEIDEGWLEQVRTGLPELPQARRERFLSGYGLSPQDASFLTLERPIADYFETAAAASGNAKATANWLGSELTGRLNAAGLGIGASPVKAESLGALVRLIDDGTISGKIAKAVFDEMFAGGGEPADIIKAKGLVQITDASQLAAVVDQVMAGNPSQVELYRKGKTATLGWFVGQVMKATGGKANPALVNQLLKEKLGG